MIELNKDQLATIILLSLFAWPFFRYIVPFLWKNFWSAVAFCVIKYANCYDIQAHTRHQLYGSQPHWKRVDDHLIKDVLRLNERVHKLESAQEKEK